jgi:nucleotide-binding universal stress UspA family protein
MIVLKNVVVATDLGALSRRTLECGREFARAFGATLHLVHVVDDLAELNRSTIDSVELGRQQMALQQRAGAALEAMLDDDVRAAGARPFVLTSDHPAAAILGYARDEHADLIVVGTHGYEGFIDLFLGTVAQQVVRGATCPVLTVRHPKAAGASAAA